MIAAVGLRWIVTVACVGIGGYCVWRACMPGGYGGHGPAVRIAAFLHAVMAVAMLAMAWPWGMGLGAGPQIGFFCLAAVWFVVAAVRWPAAGSRARAVRGAVPHALMMAAMAWMLYAMDGGNGGHGGAAGAGAAQMAGMDMSGGSALSAMRLTGAGPRLTAGVLSAVFLGLALWWLSRAFDHARAITGSAAANPAGPTGSEAASPAAVAGSETACAAAAGSDAAGPAVAGHGAWDLGCHGVMALGMSVMFVLLS